MTVCSRCGREARADELRPDGWSLNWEGSPDDAVCPGCQLATWHPHCQSLLDDDGERVAAETFEGELVLEPALAAMPREEISSYGWTWCDYVDLTVSWLDDEDGPQEWSCPRCGGTIFVGVDADYPPSGLRGFVPDEGEDDA